MPRSTPRPLALEGRAGRRSALRGTAVLAVPAALALAFAGAAVPTHAATVTVTTSAELVEAVTDANLDPDADTIVFGSNITLSASLPVVTTAITVEGAGHTLTAAGFSTFDSNVGDLVVRDLTIGGSDGPAIRSVAGSLTVENVTVTSSDVVGISTLEGVVRLSDLTIGGTGGNALTVIQSGAQSATISDVTVLPNGTAGGIELNAYGSGTIIASGISVSGNAGSVAFFAAHDATLTLSDITVTGALSSNGIYLWATSTVPTTLTGATLTGNHFHGLYAEPSDGAVIRLSGITATNNSQSGIGSWVQEATLEVSDSTLSENADAGISVETEYGTITLAGIVAADNVVHGVRAVGHSDVSTISVTDTAVSGSMDGFSLDVHDVYDADDVPAAVLVQRSTASGNDLGALLNASDDAAIRFVNSTFSGNGAGPVGGVSVIGDDTGIVELVLCTLTGNTGTTALGAFGPTLAVESSIVGANDVSAEDVGAVGSAVTIEHSLVETIVSPAVQSAVDAGAGNVGGDPQLGPLADNGGPTLTHLPATGSPVIDAGQTLGVPATDQRLLPRVSGGGVDIGSVEVPARLAATGTVGPAPLALGAALLAALGVLIVASRARRAQSPAASR